MLALAACAPNLQDMGPAQAPPRLEADAFLAADGVRLPVRTWHALGPAWAVVVAIHGFNDYSNAFRRVGPYFARRGIATYAYDQRGHGGAPHPGIFARPESLARDLADVVASVAAAHPELPLYLLGDSMGGASVLTAMARAPLRAVDGVVLAAPAVWGRATMGLVPRVALWISAHTLPWMHLTGRGLGIVPSDNIEMLREQRDDPLVIKETRIDAVYGLVDLMDAALVAASALRPPALVVYGTRDEIIPRHAVAALLERLPADGVRIAEYPESYHMLLRDLSAAVVLDDIIAWMADPAAALPSGAETTGQRFAARADAVSSEMRSAP